MLLSPCIVHHIRLLEKSQTTLAGCGVMVLCIHASCGKLYKAVHPVPLRMVFLLHAGTLLCVLLPPLTINNDSTRNSRLQTVVTSAALPLWVVAAVTTATGRVLGDAHWVSDTMAGACLGAGLVSITTILCSKLAADVKQ
jgi:hypothetical protein